MHSNFLAVCRRDWLKQGLGWLCGLALGSETWAAGEGLPSVLSLPQALEKALAQGQPLLVMVSLEGCVYCKMARQSHLVPMFKQGQPMVQVDMRTAQPVVDFSGSPTTHDQLTRAWKISVAPTLLFFGKGGREVAERMEGAYLPDFYGAYLDERLTKGRKELRP
jgi:thioredoxin-related protein